jgi:hypothetical protein
MNYYRKDGRLYASTLADLPLERAEPWEGEAPAGFLFARSCQSSRAAFCPSDARQLTARQEDAAFLSPGRLAPPPEALPAAVQRALDARQLTALNVRHPRWQEAEALSALTPRRRRVHLLAVGDVGGMLLTGLKLLGGDCISTIGICDLNENTMVRWGLEMGQVSWPWDYDALPKVEAVAPEQLFDCDVFVFAATRSIPPVGSGVADVRMAQLEANRAIAESYARQARRARFGGLFVVLSDPVDPLCRAVYQASNQGEDGQWDGQGLLPEQVHGFGLGVMNARAADLARRDPRFRLFLDEGRTFGPHGQGLVVADSVEHYHDGLSRELTEQVLGANLRIRELGFKPFVAPALSSGALQLLLTLRGKWHCGSVCLGGIWFGCRCRYTPAGLETEALALPDPLFARLREAEALLRAIP